MRSRHRRHRRRDCLQRAAAAKVSVVCGPDWRFHPTRPRSNCFLRTMTVWTLPLPFQATATLSFAAYVEKDCTKTTRTMTRKAKKTRKRERTPCWLPVSALAAWPLFTTCVWSSGVAAPGTGRHDRVSTAKPVPNPTPSPLRRRDPARVRISKPTLWRKTCSMGFHRTWWRRCGNRICGGGLVRSWCDGGGSVPLRPFCCRPWCLSIAGLAACSRNAGCRAVVGLALCADDVLVGSVCDACAATIAHGTARTFPGTLCTNTCATNPPGFGGPSWFTERCCSWEFPVF